MQNLFRNGGHDVGRDVTVCQCNQIKSCKEEWIGSREVISLTAEWNVGLRLLCFSHESSTCDDDLSSALW